MLKSMAMKGVWGWKLALAICLYKDESGATTAADLLQPQKGIQGGNDEWGILCSKKNWQDRPSDRRFQVKIFMNPNSCIFSYLEKPQHHRPVSGLGSPD